MCFSVRSTCRWVQEARSIQRHRTVIPWNSFHIQPSTSPRSPRRGAELVLPSLQQPDSLSSPSAAGNLRSTGHVRFFDGRLQDGNVVGSGDDLTGTAHRMPPELCDRRPRVLERCGMYDRVKSDSAIIHSSRTDTTSFPVCCWRSATTFCNRWRCMPHVIKI